jgi:hypothetical protein
MEKVIVCHFRKYDLNVDQYIQFFDKSKRTLEAIDSLGDGFSPIPDTCIEVDASKIDSNGCYPKDGVD